MPHARQSSRTAVVLVAVLCSSLSVVVSAHAHAEAEAGAFAAGSNGVVGIRIQHGCTAEGGGASAVDRVAVLVPAAFARAVPKAVVGWQATAVRQSDGSRRLQWRRTAASSTAHDFRIAVRFPTRAGTYGLPTVQYCGTRQIAWIERPAGGVAPAHPLPTVVVH